MMEKKEECAETVQKKNFTDVYVAASADIIGDVSMAEGSSVWYQSVVRGDHGLRLAKAAIFRMVVCCMQIRDFR